ncbi:MAG: hypothetical protein N5P05_002271 [Chroococcopsis gigantea SAG 12.99]|nr:hypothetical protein [Chroococcopsis gigantea SAG 12.99]
MALWADCATYFLNTLLGFPAIFPHGQGLFCDNTCKAGDFTGEFFQT